MNKPTCCGRVASPFTRRFGGNKIAPSVIVGFYCKRGCGHVFVPFITDWDSSYMDSMPEIRRDGIAFDESLSQPILQLPPQ